MRRALLNIFCCTAMALLVTFIDGAARSSANRARFVNPTGTYLLISKKTKRDGDTYGYDGEIRVQLLKRNRIAICFYITRGAPSYNSGSFIDTLDYRNNSATYAYPKGSNHCRIDLTFTRRHVVAVYPTIGNSTADDYSGCFGHGVIAEGTFRKISSKRPPIIHPLTGE